MPEVVARRQDIAAGAAEIVDAARRIASRVKAGDVEPDQIDEKMFAQHLYLPDVPDPDLLVRSAQPLLAQAVLFGADHHRDARRDRLEHDRAARENGQFAGSRFVELTGVHRD